MSDDINPFAAPQANLDVSREVAWANDHPEALRKVKLGLTLVYAGICGILLSLLLSPLLAFVGPSGVDGLMGLLLLGTSIVLLALLLFVGQIFCTAVPQETGAKTLAIAAVALQGIAFAVSLLAFFNPLGTLGLLGLQMVGNLASVVSLVCFLLFMRKVALYIDRPDVANRAIRALTVGTLSVALLLACGLFLSWSRVTPVGLLVLPCLIGILIALVMSANTVTYLRKAITV